MNIDKLKYLLSKIANKKKTLDEISYRKEVICEAEVAPSKEAKFLDGQLDKIINFHYESNEKLEKTRIFGVDQTHHETIAWHIRGMTLLSDRMYGHGFVSHFPTKYQKHKTTIENSSKKYYALSTSWAGVKYFGHWLRDDATTYELAKNYGEIVTLPTPKWQDKNIYAELFEQNWNSHIYGKIDNLVVFQDYAQNTNKVKRYRKLRNKIRSKASASIDRSKCIYLRRGATGINRRIVENEDVLIETLDEKGFTIVDVEKHSGSEIINQMMDANLVVTVEGSQQNHALTTLKNGGALVNITHPEIFTACPKDWADAIGFEFGFMVGDKSDQGFTVNIDDLFRTIDLVNP